MPEGLNLGCGSRPAARAASGGRPRVTVCEMSAVRFSFSRSINVRFFRHQRVNLRRLTVEEVGDGALFVKRWRWDSKLPEIILT